MRPTRTVPMGRAARFAALGAVAGLLPLSAAQAEDECRIKLIADIPARIVPENQLLIQATMNGKPVELRLDTGLGISALSRSLVLRLGLPIETAHDLRYKSATNDIYKHLRESLTELRDPNFVGLELTERTRIPRLDLGGAMTEFEEFAVVPFGGDGTDTRPVGAFGADYLLSYDVELDPAGGRVKLFEQDHCGDRVVRWAAAYSVLPLRVEDVTRRITAEVELDGQKLRAMIDTGSDYTIMPLATAARLFGLDENAPGMAEAGTDTTLDGRTVPRYAYEFKSLKIGDLVVGNPHLMLETTRLMHQAASNSHIARAAEVGPDLIIGENLLRKLHLYFAFKDSVAYFTVVPPAAPSVN